jgi:hypothetical protein
MRRRNLWEAADWGVLLWRKNFVWFIPLFALPLWTAACALRLLPDNLRYLSYLALWWLKPLFDRPVLHVVSRRFFESLEQPPRALWRGFAASLFRFLPGDLLWRRFSPRRGATLPIRILEGLKGNQYRRRKTLLAAGGLGFCGALTLLGLLLELVLFFGETGFFMMMANFIRPGFTGLLYANLKKMEFFFFIIYCFNYLLTESLYVCMGFGLYVNCRVETEGWDIQILFRRFAEEGKGRRIFNSPGMLLLLVLLCGGLQGTFAEEAAHEGDSAAPFLEDRGAPLELLEEILASPDFGGEKESWGIRMKEQAQKEDGSAPVDFSLLFEVIKKIFALLVRTLAVVSALALLTFAFLMYLWRRKKTRSQGKGGKSFSPAAALPGDPEWFFERARAFHGEGRFREGWAQALAGAIAAFSLRRGLGFPPAATEYGCLALVRSACPAEGPGFEGLIRHWVGLAYGGVLPGEGAFEEALAYGEALARIRAPEAGDSASQAGVSEAGACETGEGRPDA